MNRKNAAWVFGLCLLAAASASAADDAVRACTVKETNDCAQDCKTARCAAKCEKAAREKCRVNITVPQHVFNGAVIATPTAQCEVGFPPACASPDFVPTDPCSLVRGTVAKHALWGGPVAIYVICPVVSSGTTTTTLGQTCSSSIDGSFAMTVTNLCSGPSGCYALISAAQAGLSSACSPDAATTPSSGGDPGWSTCTAGPCPTPF
jgi:hypothetical protein